MNVKVAALVTDEEPRFPLYVFRQPYWPANGYSSNGKNVQIRGMQIGKFKDGRTVERWGGSDQLGLLKQIGISVSAHG